MPIGSTVANSGTLGYGTDLSYSTNSGSTYSSVAQILEINGLAVKVTKVDQTGLLSPNKTRQKRPGLADVDDLTLKIIYKASMMASLVNLLTGAADGGAQTVLWRVTLPDGTSTGSTAIFTGFISDLSLAVPLDDNITQDMSITVTGAYTFTQGS